MTQWFTHDIQYVRQHAVGFSGVIFTLALVESYRSTQPTRSVFGMLRVPTRLYPWVLLVVLSVRQASRCVCRIHVAASDACVSPFFSRDGIDRFAR